MQFEGAQVREQGVEFAVVIVKPHILDNSYEDERENLRMSFSSVFPNVPIILMAQNYKGIPTYHGRPDIVKFLASIDHRRIPWKRYTLT